MRILNKSYKKGYVGWDKDQLKDMGKNGVNIVIINNQVFDMTDYLANKIYNLTPDNSTTPSTADNRFMDRQLANLFTQLKGQDITKNFDTIFAGDPALKSRMQVCLRNLFFVGIVDFRNSAICKFANYLMLAVTVVMACIIVFKFLAALQFGTKAEPEEHDKFVICQVPCYTEGEESIRTTLDSLAVMKYDDKRKLLFIIADGMIVGSGNDRPTPRVILDILGVDPALDPEPLAFQSLGEGIKQLNYGKVYTGLYECSGHVVPYLVVVKVGRPAERARAGNRGKRDSQMILMRFFNAIHYDQPMTPLELEIYHQIKNVIGVDPAFYEYVLMVDADTVVMPDSLNRMISVMIHDAKIMGLCGETSLANAKDTFITMMQVYEYYISHFLAKAFESLFGSVTCLPGCFCMYRLRTPYKNSPLLVHNDIIAEYSENRVDTLHKKNLLHLGEDRFLTTLMLKNFPMNKMKFTPDAQCETSAPDTWKVLLSQRRRWINSTVHNLFELVFLERLCGFCCFSMRFVVFIDLFATLVLPASVVYLAYIIYLGVTEGSKEILVSLILLGVVYGLQAIIFLLHRKWEHIGWMIVYILAIPIFNFAIPLYSFWHFDDFSWGNTRMVVGERGGTRFVAATEDESFDPKSIPRKRWADHEQEMWEAGGSTKGGGVGGTGGGTSSDAMETRSLMSGYGGGGMAPSVMMSGMMGPSGPGSDYGGSGGHGSPGQMGGGVGPGPVDLGTYGRSSSFGAPQPPHSGSMMASSPSGPGMMMGGSGVGDMASRPGSMMGGGNGSGSPAMMTGALPGVGGGSPSMMLGSGSMMDPRMSMALSHSGMPPTGPGSEYGGAGGNVRASYMSGVGGGPGSVMGGMGGARPGSAMGGSVMGAASGMGATPPGTMPTEETILTEIRRILSTADLMSVTKKQVRDELSRLFGVDMTPKKEYINRCIEGILQGQL